MAQKPDNQRATRPSAYQHLYPVPKPPLLRGFPYLSWSIPSIYLIMKTPEDRSLPVVLYVDDDAEDRMLMADAIQMVEPRYQLVAVNDGDHAFGFLNSCRSSLPCLIILDLNIPGMNGIGIIDKLQQDKIFGSIPIVVFTTSASPTDQHICARYRVDMITKPISFSVLTETVKKILSYCKES